MIFEHSSYRSFLKEILAEKTSKNSKYSLRALAQQLDFSHSTLSEVMRGSANFSLAAAQKLAAKLNLPLPEREYLYLLVQYERTNDPEAKDLILKRMKTASPKKLKVNDLSVDTFKQIADWYHSAILEMVDLVNFEFTPTSIAKRLGITKIEAEVAVERLERLMLLKKNEKGKFVRISDQLITKTNSSNYKAMRTFFKQMLQKAANALDTQNPDERVSGFETMSIPQEAISEAREITEQYFRDMIGLSNSYPKKKHVYHLIVHFFNLTSERE